MISVFKKDCSLSWVTCLFFVGACSEHKGGTFGGGASGEPVYVVNTTIPSTDDSMSTYFGVLGSLGPEAKFDTTTSLEAPGMAKLYAREGLGWFALGDGETPTVTRYELDAKGAFVKGDVISFQPRGTQYLADTMVFVSKTKAYYFDAPNTQLIRWNPEAMVVDGVIDLSRTARPGLTTIFDIKPLLRDDGTLLFTVAWRNFDTNETFHGTGLVVIDTASDAVRKYTVSERCQGVTWSAILSNGDYYSATTPFYSVLQRVTGAGPAACALRVRASGDEFDPGWVQDLSQLVAGRLAGGLAKGPDGVLFFRALDPGVEVTKETNPATIWSGSVWRWYRWELASNAVSAVEGLPSSAAGGLTYEVDGKVLATDSAADFSSTTLIDMTAPGGPRPALETPGYVYGVARVR